ncbi:MAG: levansucrase [Pseudomonadota bacterium]
MLAFEDRWIWDFWLTQDAQGLWHCYFLQARKSLMVPIRRHFNVTHGHATSKDLINWQDQGACLTPSSPSNFDDYTIWTGSVVHDTSGRWHYFYTGTSQQDRALIQRIGHAVGDDGHTFARVGDGLALDHDPAWYERYDPSIWHDQAWRDPWVMAHPEGRGWLMAYTARIKGVPVANEGGAIGLAHSDDLTHWQALPPLFAGQFGQLEVPQIFTLGGRWYCLFCVRPEHWSSGYEAGYRGRRVAGTHYLMAQDFAGPWRVAPGPFLTSVCDDELYAARLVMHEGAPYLLGFWHDDPQGNFIGTISDPIPVTIDEKGLLALDISVRHSA